MRISVVGLGKIGLPLAVQYCKKGHQVTGVDINPEVIKFVNKGIEPFPEEENLSTYLKEVVQSGLLFATGDTSAAVAKTEFVVIAVPLFVDSLGNPDFSALDDATKKIALGLIPGTLVSYETTLPLGTTRSRFARIIEEVSGLIAGKDYWLVFSPERVLTGRVFTDLRKYPKIVGGISKECGMKAYEFYNKVLDFDPRTDLSKSNGVWVLESAESAEFVKLAETTYRDVNIGLANQFAQIANKYGIDIFQVIEAANSQPYSNLHVPGISVGGHCIPIYPQFILWTNPEATIVRASREQNASMPLYFIQSLEKVLGNIRNLQILILGISYRPNVKEHAFSGTLELNKLIRERGGKVVVVDPLYTLDEILMMGLTPLDKKSEIDVVILHTSHREFLNYSYLDFPKMKVFLDGRGFMSHWREAPGIKFISISN